MQNFYTLIFPMLVFFVGMIVVGIIFSRKSKTVDDYLVASRSLPTWLAVMTFVATIFGGGMLTGRAQNAYLTGYFFLWYGLCTVVGRLLLAGLITRMEDFSKTSTVTEYLEIRYGSKFLRVSCSVLSMFALLGVTASQINALTSILNAFGIENTVLYAFIGMCIVIILTSLGGIWTVTTTDAYQLVIVVVGVFWLLCAVLSGNGGLGGINDFIQTNAASLPAHFGELFSSSHVSGWLLMCTPAVMYTLIGQESYQRLYACKNIREARKCAVISSIIAFTISLAPCIIGFAGRIDFPGLAESGESNMILGKMALEYLPGMAGGIFLCACLAAILSTADSNLSAAASHFMNDIYLPLGGAVTEKRKLVISRIATAVMGFGAVFVSFSADDLHKLLAVQSGNIIECNKKTCYRL